MPRGEAGRFDGVLSQRDAERLVTQTGIRAPAFRLVRDGLPLPAAAYAEDIPWRPSAFTATARVPRVAEEFARGATIVLQALHLHWLPAARYCRGLEAALGVPVQANAYHTPASAQGFAVHHDTHDVFVLQVAGRKRWRLYAPVLELPLPHQRWSAALGCSIPPTPPVQELLLEPGDTLYVPRGWPHEAATGDGESLHVTVGLHPPTRMDVLRAALDAAAEEDVELRRNAAADGTLPEDLLQRVSAQLEPARVAARLRRRFVLGRRPIVPDQLDQVRALDRLTPDTPLRRRDTVIADLDGGVLRFEGKEIRFPPQALEAVAALHAADGPVTPRDLPGTLDGAGRLVLVRRLVREGYLTVSVPCMPDA